MLSVTVTDGELLADPVGLLLLVCVPEIEPVLVFVMDLLFVAAGVMDMDPLGEAEGDALGVTDDDGVADVVGLVDEDFCTLTLLLGVLLREATTLGVREGVLELESDALLVRDAEEVGESVGEAVELLELVMLLVEEADCEGLFEVERVTLFVRVGVEESVREREAALLDVTLGVADTLAVALDVALGEVVGEAVSLGDREADKEGDFDTEGDRDGVLATLFVAV